MRKALREEKPAACSWAVAPVEHGADAGRERRALHRDPPVALDEHEQHVLAAEAGQQPVPRGRAEAVVGELAREPRTILQARAHRLHLVDGQGGRARGGDRRAEDPERHPGDAQHRRRPQRPAAVAGCDPCDAQQREHREGEQRGDQHDRDRDGEVCARAADRVAQGLDADARVARVGDRVEGPVEGGEEPHVEDLHEHEHAQHRAHHDGQHAARGRGQQHGQRDHDEQLEGEPGVGAEVEVARPVRGDERGPDEQQGEDGEGHGEGGGLGRRGFPAAPQPPRALAHRRAQRHQRGEQEGLRERVRQHAGGRDRQHDPLRRGDDPAPAPPRERRAHPRQQPLAGQEHVARRADRQHPRAGALGDVDAQREDQERVDLAVEARAQRRRRAGAPRDPSVGRVERERDGGERHQQHDRRLARERADGERGDAGGERGPGERHPRRRPPASLAHTSRNRGESA